VNSQRPQDKNLLKLQIPWSLCTLSSIRSRNYFGCSLVILSLCQISIHASLTASKAPTISICKHLYTVLTVFVSSIRPNSLKTICTRFKHILPHIQVLMISMMLDWWDTFPIWQLCFIDSSRCGPLWNGCDGHSVPASRYSFLFCYSIHSPHSFCF